MEKREPIVIAYGGGTNSCAMLIGLKNKGIRPDLIIFADTGGEKPETYAHIDMMSGWCNKAGFPEIITVQSVNKLGEKHTIEGLCLERNMLPSIAYGFKSCSLKHKVAPLDKYVNNHPITKGAWADKIRSIRMIGIDADEAHRAKYTEEKKWIYQYPLLEWDWGRDECIDAIQGEGLPLPGKSSCFFCPSMKKKEILQLNRMHPELMERALAMEAGADLTSIKGLGRSFSWADFLAADEAQGDMFPDSLIDIDCGCYDG